MKIKKILFVFLLLMACTGTASAQLYPLPVNAQVIVFKRIFPYLKSLQRSENIRVLIVYDNVSENNKNLAMKAFQSENMTVSSCRTEQLPFAIKEATVVYIPENLQNSSVKALCRKNKVLSITGDPALVSRGEASIGVGNASKNEAGRKYKLSPRVIINLTQLQYESQEVTELLTLDTIIKVK